MASPKFALLLVLALAASLLSSAPAAQGYCRDSLNGLLLCRGFMFEGAPAASPACCDAYNAAINTAPFCLCYIANGVYGRATGFDVNVTRALQIPTTCGLVQPPIELCSMQGVVLPPYEPESPAASPAAQPPSAWSSPARDATAPPPPPPTSRGAHDSSVQMALVFFTVALAMVAATGASP